MTMNASEATKEARKRWGETGLAWQRVIVGGGCRTVFCVGIAGPKDGYTVYGVGKTFEEAFSEPRTSVEALGPQRVVIPRKTSEKSMRS